VRILSATRRDLEHEVQARRFRDDLYHRLAVATIELPPLRRRRGDITLLARRFARDFGAPDDTLPTSLLARWEELPWPGNVRELRNAVARRMALGDLAPDASASGTLPPSVDEGDAIEWVLAQRLPLVPA